jgi:hypothetical protein
MLGKCQECEKENRMSIIKNGYGYGYISNTGECKKHNNINKWCDLCIKEQTECSLGLRTFCLNYLGIQGQCFIHNPDKVKKGIQDVYGKYV